MPDLRVWHPLTLPSEGRFYKSAAGEPLCPGGKIEYALWTTEAEEILVRYGEADDIADRMLRSNIKLPETMEYEDLLVSDQFYILMKLRAESLCPYYTYTCGCRKCKKEYEVQANLQELKLLDINNVADEPISCALPAKGVELQLRFPRVKDAVALQKLEKELEEKQTPDGVLLYQYARQIVKVDGESMPFNEKKDLVRSLTMLDTSAIRMVLEDNDIGYNLMDESECTHCGTANQSAIPIDVRFFRPSRTDIATAVRVAREARRRD